MVYDRLYRAKCWMYDNHRNIDVDNNIVVYYLTLHRMGEESVHVNVTLTIKYRYTLIGDSFRRGTVGYTCRVEQCVHSVFAVDSSMMSWRPKHIIDTIIFSNLSVTMELYPGDVDKIVETIENYHDTIMSPSLTYDIMHNLQCMKRNIAYVEKYCKCTVTTFGDICKCCLSNDFW